MSRTHWRGAVAWILALVLVVPALGWVAATPAAAATLPVSQDLKVHGDYILVGNGVLTCSTSDTNCVNLLRGNSDSQNYVNDVVNMVNNNPVNGMANSSSATLTIPSGAKVAYAELVWSANTGVIQGVSGSACSQNGAATLPQGTAATPSHRTL